MTISMYQASVPVFIRMLTNLKGILEKAAAHAQAKKIDESVLLNARLYPDMFPLIKQVHIATDFARGTGARLSGAEPPSYEDNEKTIAELVARVERSIDYLRTLKPAAKPAAKPAKPAAKAAKPEAKAAKPEAKAAKPAKPGKATGTSAAKTEIDA